MKDRAGRGGSPSIPAGNNGAAGQECCLQEEGVRQEVALGGYCFERKSSYVSTLKSRGTERNVFFRMLDVGEEVGGCM